MQDAPRAKKSLGQNFLQDANIARKIVRTLDICPEDAVLEIGPGPGALSGILQAAQPKQLVLVEKDTYWATERAQGEVPYASPDAFFAAGTVENGKAFSVIMADALTMPWERFVTPWKFIGNLPYNIASPLMWEIFSRARGLRRAVFMIQKEVGLRIVAKPGTSAYGALSVWVQTFMRPKLEYVVPPQVFHPRPKVDSAVLSFVPVLCQEGEDAGNTQQRVNSAHLAATLHTCFQMRRKQLGSIARSCGSGHEALERLGVNPTLRPEALDVNTFHMLARSEIFVRTA